MGGAVRPYCLTWGQTTVEVMQIMATSFKRSHACTAALSNPNPVAGHGQPTSPPETLGHSWTSLGQSVVGSLLLSPGSWCTQAFVCALQESVSPVLCKFWRLYGGINGDLLQVGLGTQVYCTQSPCPCSSLLPPIPLQETLKHSFGSVSGSWCTQGVFEHSKHLWRVWGLILNAIFPLLPSCWGFSFALGCGVSFFGWDPTFPVVGCSAVSLNFGVLTGEDEFFQEKMSWFKFILSIYMHCI